MSSEFSSYLAELSNVESEPVVPNIELLAKQKAQRKARDLDALHGAPSTSSPAPPVGSNLRAPAGAIQKAVLTEGDETPGR